MIKFTGIFKRVVNILRESMQSIRGESTKAQRNDAVVEGLMARTEAKTKFCPNSTETLNM